MFVLYIPEDQSQCCQGGQYKYIQIINTDLFFCTTVTSLTCTVVVYMVLDLFAVLCFHNLKILGRAIMIIIYIPYSNRSNTINVCKTNITTSQTNLDMIIPCSTMLLTEMYKMNLVLDVLFTE